MLQMNNNLHSLLSSNWMFANNSETSLYPFLFNIINGNNEISNLTLPATEFSFIQNNGNITPTPTSTGNVAVIKMHHPIFKYDQNCGPQGTQSIMAMMESWKEDSSIKGVLFDKFSGGGQASGCSDFAEYVANYPKPIGTYTKDTIGSAAYYDAAASDFIVMDKHADFIGCIGSMTSRVNMKGILIKKGATIEEFYSDLSPEKNLQARELDNGNEKPLIEKFLNPAAQKFHDDMKLYRPQISEKALKGDVFNPEEALKEGLIDEIGNFQRAIDKIFELSNSSNTNNNSTTNISKTTNIMSKLNVPLIETVLGSPFAEGETENGIILNDAEAVLLENKLSENDTALATAATEATASTEKFNALKESKEALTTVIQQALVTAEVAGAEKMSNEEGIEALSALVLEYSPLDGANSTQTLDALDNADGENENIVGGIDISGALNN